MKWDVERAVDAYLETETPPTLSTFRRRGVQSLSASCCPIHFMSAERRMRLLPPTNLQKAIVSSNFPIREGHSFQLNAPHCLEALTTLKKT
jgi:hypothetical protein